MVENREAILVMKAFKFPVQEQGRTVVKQFYPGQFLPRRDWDAAPARSRRSMTNVGYVRDSLNVEINTITGQPEQIPEGKPATVRIRPPGRKIEMIDQDGNLIVKTDPGGVDRKIQARSRIPELPAPKRRGRPPKPKA